MRIIAKFATILFLLVATASQVAAQGCSMCYASAAQQEAEAQRALNLGILVLLIPPVLLFGGVMVTAFRRRNEFPEPESNT